jgi:hypothetical protein
LLFRLSYESDLDMQAGIEPARDELQLTAFPFRHCMVLAALSGIEPRPAGSEPAALPLS